MNDYQENPSAWNTHIRFMRTALEEAKLAMSKGEVPVGAVIVKNNIVVGKGHNMVETLKDPSAHAEMIALSSACSTLENKYLTDCTLYVTLEPCPMCTGALVWSKISRIVMGTLDAKAGACGSIFNLANHNKLNHKIELVHSILEEESASLLKNFFRDKR